MTDFPTDFRSCSIRTNRVPEQGRCRPSAGIRNRRAIDCYRMLYVPITKRISRRRTIRRSRCDRSLAEPAAATKHVRRNAFQFAKIRSDYETESQPAGRVCGRRHGLDGRHRFQRSNTTKPEPRSSNRAGASPFVTTWPRSEGRRSSPVLLRLGERLSHEENVSRSCTIAVH